MDAVNNRSGFESSGIGITLLCLLVGCGGEELVTLVGPQDAAAPEDVSVMAPEARAPEVQTVSTFFVGGVVSGLEGTGLVVKNAGLDPLPIEKDGAFRFPTKLAKGASYLVEVASQPTGPAQTCELSAGSGVVGDGDVTDVAVRCTTNRYSVGGTVSGVVGAGLVLRNGGEDLPILQDGTFTFPTTVRDGQAFDVTVASSPQNPAQTCTVVSGSGTVASANVQQVAVTCVTNQYRIGGSISGLVGTGLVLENNAADPLNLSPSDTTFSFAAPVDSGRSYAVTVKTQPTNPSQQCTVSGGSGTVGAADVSSVVVSCSTNQFTVGGTVTGLSVSGLVLQNGSETVTVNGSGDFAFATPVPSGQSYAVSIGSQPPGNTQVCSLTRASGTVASANVTDVAVACLTRAAAPTFGLAAGTYSGTQSVAMTSATSGATIRYTTDGSEPTDQSTMVSGPVSVSSNTTLRAIAFANGFAESTVSTVTYGIRAAAPLATPSGGLYTAAQTVSLASATPGASVRYTLNGSTPTSSVGTVYTSPFQVSVNTTLKAVAYKTGMEESLPLDTSYTIVTGDILGCAAGQVVVGIYGRSGSWLDRLGVICATRSGNSIGSPVTNPTTIGGDGGGPFSFTCPANQAVSRVYGHNFSGGTEWTARISVECTPPGGGTATVSGSYGSSSGDAFNYACSSGQYVQAIVIRSGITPYYTPHTLAAPCR